MASLTSPTPSLSAQTLRNSHHKPFSSLLTSFQSKTVPFGIFRFVLKPFGVAPSRGIKSREVKRYWTEDGVRDPPLQDAVDRFKRLRWGAFIHARAGRRKHLYRKNPWVVAKKDEHILTNRATSFLVDNLVNRYWRRPQFYPQDIYEPYHKRTGSRFEALLAVVVNHLLSGPRSEMASGPLSTSL
ncbi:unnamed protein product [Schistocephalus solidus]|uniref:39S ribosomal protein L35 n=1 Tax=Schistocephalus solidus TaxID=70667 RepID=A0A183STJ8_SCHSO|nr:unnamed protein product [Schistocephalus solidus]